MPPFSGGGHGDGDLVDTLVDSLTTLTEGGVVWVLTPKSGRDGYVSPADIQDAAPTAGLHSPPPPASPRTGAPPGWSRGRTSDPSGPARGSGPGLQPSAPFPASASRAGFRARQPVRRTGAALGLPRAATSSWSSIPFAFSGICTGELCEIRDNLALFEDADAAVLAVSVDSKFAQRAYAEKEGYGFDLLADFWPHGAVASAYGVFDPESGMALRGTFIIDADGNRPLRRGESARPGPGLRRIPGGPRGTRRELIR